MGQLCMTGQRDVITYEFENVDAQAVELLEAYANMFFPIARFKNRPNRWFEKVFARLRNWGGRFLKVTHAAILRRRPANRFPPY